MNLIIGAVVSTFEELHRKGAGMDMLTEAQRRWVYTQQVLQSVRLLTRLRVPPAVAGYDCHPNNVRRFCFRLCVPHKDRLLVEDRKMMGQRFYGDVFGGFIMVIIVSNTIIMLFYAPRADEMSQSQTLREFSMAVDVPSNPPNPHPAPNPNPNPNLHPHPGSPFTVTAHRSPLTAHLSPSPSP